MVIINNHSTTEQLSLEEFWDFVQNTVDVEDKESIRESSLQLKMLANNRGFLSNEYNAEIKRFLDGRPLRHISPQSMAILSSPKFLVRANIWLPPPTEQQIADSESKLYSYNMVHDHNFSFCSVGYFGPGYRTELYTYCYDQVVGFFGERVELNYRGSITLHAGETIFYEANKDVHSQLPPKTPSITINLMALSSSIQSRPQFVFDTQKSTISGAVSDQCSSRRYILDFLRVINDENSTDILTSIIKSHPSDRLKGAAASILSEIKPDLAEWALRYAGKARRFVRSDMVHAGFTRYAGGL